MSYTKGNWTYGNHLCSDGMRVFVRHEADNDQHDAICDLETWQDETETEANARLISAAPDLLVACKVALKKLSGHPSFWDTRGVVSSPGRLLEEAIAKVEGKEKNATSKNR